MSSPDWVVALITMVGTVFSGFALKALEAWLTKASTKQKVDSELREEYRDTITDKRKDIAELKEDIEDAQRKIDRLNEELNEWKTKYFNELGEKMDLLARLRALEERYKNEQ